MNVTKLPPLLTSALAREFTRLNASLRAGQMQLDWSAVEDAAPESLAPLLDGLDLSDDADALGLETIPERLHAIVLAALDRSSDGKKRRRVSKGGAAVPASPSVPEVWAADTADTREDVIGVEAADERRARPTRGTTTLTLPPVLTPPAPSALRDEMMRLVLSDLLGPAGGPTEELTEDPQERYLVGMLAPRNLHVAAETQDDLAESGTDTAEDGAAEPSATAAMTLFPSSFGLTVCVEGTATALSVAASWGGYTRVTSETMRRPTDDEPMRVWRRAPMGNPPRVIPLVAGNIDPWVPDPRVPHVHVRGTVRRVADVWLVTLWLVNDQSEPRRLRDASWLFQPELRVAAPDGAPIFVQRANLRTDRNTHLPTDLVAYAEDRTIAMQYRNYREFAVGHGVGVHADLSPDDATCATSIRTVVVPSHDVPVITSAETEDFPALDGLVVDMAMLAETPDGGFTAALTPLLTAYGRWIADQEARIGDPATGLAAYDEHAREALDGCRRAQERIAAGIALLDAHPQAAEAFRFANRAMWQQRIHTLMIDRAQSGPTKPDRAAVDIPVNRSWRLFQLAFILLNLPSLTDVHHEDRADDAAARADLLWFPTGGGKTEAYLGLTAFTLAIRRLQGTVEGRSGMDGVAVLMRYTLRLLTVQQFTRAAALICACEMIRRDAASAGDHRWGATPFRLGLWVGYRTTPNSTAQAVSAIANQHGMYGGSGGSGTPAQLTRCPWCGAPIDPGKHIVVNKEIARTILYCGDPQGDCPFSARRAPDEGLPVLVVDEEIYRRLPALLIATVDKFAQMPWNGATQMLFGRVNGYCPRHGFRSPEIEDSDSHPAKYGLPAVRTQPHGPLRPPDLIIQDELHLISGPLGTLVGLYETVIDRLCTWEVGGKRVRPKVIASTATVRRARDQMHALFLRRVAIFPPQGLDAGDNFFALERAPTATLPGRRYIGICAPGKRLKAVLIRVYVAHLTAAQRLYNEYGKYADPWMTLVGYFNAMRELGGMRRLVEDDVRAKLGTAGARGLANRPPPYLEELTSRRSSEDIPRVLAQLETGFDPVWDARYKAGERTNRPRPIDVLLATNMLSVGVDIQRLGLMVVAGQPKTTAEYIQATSRVGRRSPGLVCTVFNWARPRDLSHYEQFEHYHATFYQHVEALSVTPFASRAIDRGLTGLLVAYLRLMDGTLNANDRAGRISWENPYVKRALDEIAARAEQVSAHPDIADTVRAELSARVDAWIAHAQQTAGGRILGYKSKRDGVTLGLLQQPDSGGWQTFTCLNSLRDVEPTVNLMLDDRALGDEATHPFQANPPPEKDAE
ncbi:MAG: DISARM system helicase DrmA [Thermomicrobiales bacterium]